jgi:hypothetical protein
MSIIACYEEILREKKSYLSRHNSKLNFLKPSSGTRTSPPVILVGEDDDPDDPTAVQEECLLLKLSLVCHFIFL